MSFLQQFAELPEPRSQINRNDDFLDIVFLTVCAVLSGAEGWKDIEKIGHKKLSWLRVFRRLEQGIPVDDTISRIIRALDPERMAQCLINRVNAIRRQQSHQIIAIDGKTVRHNYHTEPKDALHAITVWLGEQSLVFSQSESAGKRNEIQSVQALIDRSRPVDISKPVRR